MKTKHIRHIRKWISNGVATSVAVLSVCAFSARADLTHRYSFTTDASDSVGGANATLVNSAAVSGGQLQLNNPNFSPGGNPDPNGYATLSPSVLPGSGAATIETWFTFTGSGFFTEAWTFCNGSDSSPPSGAGGQYFMDTISAPQGGPVPSGGGNHIVQSGLGGGYAFTPETLAFGTTPGMGAFGGGYLDNGDSCFSAVTIAADGTISYYLYDITANLGGLQQTVAGNPLSSYNYTLAYLGRSAFSGDNATSGSIDEFRIYDNAQSAAAVAADFAAGPDTVVPVPEPASLALLGLSGLVLVLRRRMVS